MTNLINPCELGEENSHSEGRTRRPMGPCVGSQRCRYPACALTGLASVRIRAPDPVCSGLVVPG